MSPVVDRTRIIIRPERVKATNLFGEEGGGQNVCFYEMIRKRRIFERKNSSDIGDVRNLKGR